MSLAKSDKENTHSPAQAQHVVERLWGVRYQVKDVRRSIEFYGASGSRPMPDGRQQEPGGWNRVVLQVNDLPARVADLRNRGAHFRNELEVGPGGKQIQVEDPDGNPIELFEPARR
jgi:glyoxylase I family protein